MAGPQWHGELLHKSSLPYEKCNEINGLDDGLSILILPPRIKGQTCSVLSFAPAIPRAGGASRSVRILAPRIFVAFWPLAGAFPSQISVCAKVVLRIEAGFPVQMDKARLRDGHDLRDNAQC